MHSVTTILKLFLLQLNSILFRYFSNVLCLILVWDLLIIEKYSYVFFLLLSCFVFVNFILLQGAGLNYSQYTVHRNCELISETTCEFDFESAEWDGKCGCLMFGLDLCWFFSFVSFSFYYFLGWLVWSWRKFVENQLKKFTIIAIIVTAMYVCVCETFFGVDQLKCYLLW